jgi:L-ascorbate peroxidase
MLILGYCISRDSFFNALTLLSLSVSSENGFRADRPSQSQRQTPPQVYNPLPVSFPSTTTTSRTNTNTDMISVARNSPSIDFQPIQEQQQRQQKERQRQRQRQANNHRPEEEEDQYHISSAWFRNEINQRVRDDPSLAGPLIRLAFHDAATFESSPTYVLGNHVVTGGSNGSIQYEQARTENRGIQRPLDVIQSILFLLLLEKKNDAPKSSSQSTKATTSTPSTTVVLSLADAIALGGAAAVEAVGGPHIAIRMGRSDVTTADPEQLRVPSHKATKRSLVNRTLPSAGLDSIGLRLFFGRLALSEEEFVALSGAHGLGRHVSLLGMSKQCLKQLTRTCLEEARVLLPFVKSSVDQWDPSSYFDALLRWNTNQVKLGEVAFLPTDVALVVDDGLARHVQRFAQDLDYFNRVYARAYSKLVDHTATTVQRY